MEHKWLYEGHEYLFDVSESESMARISSALSDLRTDTASLPQNPENPADGIREQCLIIRKFFDAVLGEGCGAAVCGDTMSADQHTVAYMEFIMFVNAQVTEFRNKMAAIGEKYLSRAKSYGA